MHGDHGVDGAGEGEHHGQTLREATLGQAQGLQKGASASGAK